MIAAIRDLLKRSVAPIKQFLASIKQRARNREVARITALIARHNCDGHIDALHLRIAALDSKGVLTPEEQQQRVELDEILTFLIRTAAAHYSSINDEVIEKTIAEVIQMCPMTAMNSFPMEAFMDYAEPIPKFNVGDIVWAVIGATPQSESVNIRAVIVSRTIDFDCIVYTVAPYGEKINRVQVIPGEFLEDELSLDDPEPSRRLKVVK